MKHVSNDLNSREIGGVMGDNEFCCEGRLQVIDLIINICTPQ